MLNKNGFSSFSDFVCRRILLFCEHCRPCCQMVRFQTKNPNLGKFARVLQWKMMVYSMDTRSILRSLVIFYWHLVKFVEIWFILYRCGILYQEKSGNTDCRYFLSIPLCKLIQKVFSLLLSPPKTVFGFRGVQAKKYYFSKCLRQMSSASDALWIPWSEWAPLLSKVCRP
jgi:hypothetical protein